MFERFFELGDDRTMTALMIAGMAIVVSFLLLRTTRFLSRQQSTRLARGRDPASTPAEAVQWDVRMHETARELFGQLDSKMSALMSLTADADRAAARLETALRSASDPRRGNHQAAGLRPEPSIEPAVESSLAPRTDEAYDGRDKRAQTGSPTAGDRRKEEVYTLADYGHAAAEIAQRTGIPVGEVELILSLRARPR